MRQDFQNNRDLNTKSGWPKARIIRAIVFIVIGLAVGFWLHQTSKQDNQPTYREPAPQAQMEIEEDTSRTYPIELPRITEYS